MKSRTLLTLLVGSTILLTSFQAADAKEWTINERQNQLMKDINDCQKKRELTDKEAKKLRSKLADVARKEAKMRAKKSTGVVSDVDKVSLEKDLNEISIDIKKLALEKRVDAASDKGDEEKAAVKKAKDKEKAEKKAAAKAEKQKEKASK